MSEEKPVILLGDTTTHGGQVITASDSMTVNDIPVALVGHLVTCPRCEGVFPIVQGSPSASVDDAAVARHGDVTACGAQLLASQSQVTVP
jgi:uncharacterized Zn-binding protein involved in type VI secretion